MKLSRLAALLVPLSLVGLCGAAHADAYPARPISIVVPYPAGGTNDIIARVVGARMAESMGVPVIVENRAGAGGNIGARHVARAPADGYVLGAVPAGVLAINQWVYPDAGFDPAVDLAPVGLAGSVPNVFVVNPALPVGSIQELVASAKQNPGKLNFASMGTGTTGHLCGEMFRMLTGTDIAHVPYKGAAPAMADLLAGHVGLMCDNLTNALPHIQAGKLKALAVTSLERTPMLPSVPTLDEAGVKGFEATAWFGFVAPGGTPPAVVERLNAEIGAALKDEQVQKRLTQQGLTIQPMLPGAFSAFIAAETRKWREVVQRSNIRAD
ncbi:MAG: tripartite tricarboxylate transporter substrate binding protein [Pigmentiphaga sp.]|uniref:Bug family tripartite tricarboxylate transporter substrate binding protein n=1 Tax=Pigmentiphaga sp. TaxID=1977564 RepID=UPI0029A15597|nr:tripartite tricarboxylate transporter substrate binding protein [Pigmentiphaga sp.]MDX3904397.1 tripartite tricarboxylate transporter substrate binding protein [Pigmentiphaga sp.]